MKSFARVAITFLPAILACIGLLAFHVPAARAGTEDPRLRIVDMTVAPEAVAGLIDEIAALGRAQYFAVRLDPEAAVGRLMMYAPDMTIVVVVGAPLGDGMVRVIVADGPYEASAYALQRWDRLLGTFCSTRAGLSCAIAVATPGPRTRLMGQYTLPIFSVIEVRVSAEALPDVVAGLDAAVARHRHVLLSYPGETAGPLLEVFDDDLYAFALANRPPRSPGFRIVVTHGARKPTVDTIDTFIRDVMDAAASVPGAAAVVVQ